MGTRCSDVGFGSGGENLAWVTGTSTSVTEALGQNSVCKTRPRDVSKSTFVTTKTTELLASSLGIAVVSETVSPSCNVFLDENRKHIWLLAVNPGQKLRII